MKKVTITFIELRSPWKFFPLSLYAMSIFRQLNSTRCIKLKKGGFWTKHYTITLWENEADLKQFASSGAHLQAMKQTRKLAKEVRTYTMDADSIPDWKSAKALVMEKGGVLKF